MKKIAILICIAMLFPACISMSIGPQKLEKGFKGLAMNMFGHQKLENFRGVAMGFMTYQECTDDCKGLIMNVGRQKISNSSTITAMNIGYQEFDNSTMVGMNIGYQEVQSCDGVASTLGPQKFEDFTDRLYFKKGGYYFEDYFIYY